MNYDEIVALSLSYSDREDNEVKNRINDFIKIVEAKINRVVKVGKMVSRATLPTNINSSYYGLPPDFGSLRDIQLNSGSTIRTLMYMSPEQMNNISNMNTSEVYYTLIANQLQIHPKQDSLTLEITYYRKVPPINKVTPGEDVNWVSEQEPDCYVFGILAEISAFVKDIEALEIWDGRFKEVLQNMMDDDARSRWSGTALQTRVG